MDEEERISNLMSDISSFIQQEPYAFTELFWCYVVDRHWDDEKIDDFCHYILDDKDSYPYVTLGAFVKWRDPGIKDYPSKEREELLNRKFEVLMIDNDPDISQATCGSIILIGDGTTEAEVPVHELMPYDT